MNRKFAVVKVLQDVFTKKNLLGSWKSYRFSTQLAASTFFRTLTIKMDHLMNPYLSNVLIVEREVKKNLLLPPPRKKKPHSSLKCH